MTILTEKPSTILIDVGAHLIKFSMSTDSKPKIMPTVIGTLKPQCKLQSPCSDKIYIGNDAVKNRRVLNLVNPIKRGLVTNWNAMEKILRHVFENELSVDPSKYQIILALPQKLEANREKFKELLFDNFQVPSLAIFSQPHLALLSSQISTGIVIDLGHSLTQIAAFYEKQPLEYVAKYFPIAGNEISEQLKINVNKGGISSSENIGQETMRKIKEKCCFVKVKDEDESMHYKLEDGNEIVLESERSDSTEILFKPELWGEKPLGLHEAIRDVIESADERIQKDLYKHILLTGGTSKLEGLIERLEKELKAIVPSRTKVSIKIIPHEFATWHGAKVIASSPYFESFLNINY